jgi:putative oxidoreductase
MFMSDTPKLLIPQFGPLYRALAPATEPLVRIAVGLSLAAHGYPKLFGNVAGSAAFFEQAGYSPGLFWSVLVGLTETVGGLCFAAGFLTRLVGVPILIFLLVAIQYHTQFGFYWNARGIEYPLVLTLVVLHYLVRGGGPWSVDARIGREF